MHSRCCWPPERFSAESFRRSFTSSQSRRLPQAPLRDLRQLGAVVLPSHARAVDCVFENRLGERIGFLKHHAHTPTQLHQVDVATVNVLAVEQNAAGVAGAVDQVVHAVEQPQKRRLAAPRRPDQGHYRAFGNLQGNIEQSLLWSHTKTKVRKH